MTKPELKTGMIVEFSNGEKGLVMLDHYSAPNVKGVIVFDGHWTDFDSWKEDLTSALEHTELFKIVKVYKPSLPCYSIELTNAKESNLTLLWERPEFTYPMWFKHKYSPLVVKFTSIDKGEVIIEGSSRKFGETAFAKHTDKNTWEQVDEPKVCEYSITGLSKELGIHPSLIRIKE